MMGVQGMWSSGETDKGYSAVYFMDGVEVSRQMRASEFEAFLDGYVGLSDLADTDVRSVYVEQGPDLLIRALVFFTIYFDEVGRADPQWNLPLEKLAAEGAKGPDLGAGPIRLVCRSQCPVPELGGELWDPDMTPGSNHFHSIRKAADANSLKFRKQDPEPVAEESIPVLDADSDDSEETAGSETQADRSRLAQLIREQRLRIKTLQSVHRDALSDLQREHRLDMRGLRQEMAELEQKYERQRLTNEQLKKRLAERNEQYLTMQERLQSGESAAASSRDAEVVLLREQLERRQRELEVRDERIVLLEQENHDLKHREPPEDSLLKRLQEQTVFLVAYHPGVGHVTLPYKELDQYFRNPVAYAAARSGLSEPAYREWLAHYENPVCQGAGKDGNTCGKPVMRVSRPAEFLPGQDDRCELHKK